MMANLKEAREIGIRAKRVEVEGGSIECDEGRTKAPWAKHKAVRQTFKKNFFKLSMRRRA